MLLMPGWMFQPNFIFLYFHRSCKRLEKWKLQKAFLAAAAGTLEIFAKKEQQFTLTDHHHANNESSMCLDKRKYEKSAIYGNCKLSTRRWGSKKYNNKVKKLPRTRCSSSRDTLELHKTFRCSTRASPHKKKISSILMCMRQKTNSGNLMSPKYLFFVRLCAHSSWRRKTKSLGVLGCIAQCIMSSSSKRRRGKMKQKWKQFKIV